MNAKLFNMKTKKSISTFIYLLIFLIGNNIYSQESRTFLGTEETINSLSINGLGIKDLNEPGKFFENLENLGKPLNIKYSETFVEKLWIYEYNGFQLTFVNVNGYPELLELNINNLNTEFKICLNDKRLNEKELLNELKNSNKLKGIKTRFIEKGVKNSEKFEGKAYFLEINVNNNYEKVAFILFKNKVV